MSLIQLLRSQTRRFVVAVPQKLSGLIAKQWEPYSRLFIASDSATWVLDWEKQALIKIAQQLRVKLASEHLLPYANQQSLFYCSQFALLEPNWQASTHRVGFAYFHGRPGTPNAPQFDECYRYLQKHHQRLHRLQVSHTEMRDIVLSSGIAPEKVFLIPIGINLDYFFPQTSASRQQARQTYNIPQSAVVVGSFQKDGVGWEAGNEPKLIKGPDVFLETIALIKNKIPELFVLLSGPARGYVKAGLESLGVPYRHYQLEHYPQVGKLFQALDLYLVTSRQEGGPKAVLEAMASGVPLVTTRVGQAMDLVQHGSNAWMVEVEDAEGLAYWAEYALTHTETCSSAIQAGLQTAAANSYTAQIPLWRQFMKGFVGLPS